MWLCIPEVDAQGLTGKVTDTDNASIPLFQASKVQNGQVEQDSTISMAETKKRGAMAHRRYVLDSMMNIASQRTHTRPDPHRADRAARQKDSIRAQRALLVAKIKSIQQDRLEAEQDSQLIVAEAQNKEIMASRKHIRDSLELVDGQLLQSKRDRQKELEAKELAEKQTREKEAEDKKRAEMAQKEKLKRELAELKRAREDQGRADGPKTGHYMPDKRPQLEKDLAAMKKARQEAEAKALSDKPKKDTVPKSPKPESKPIVDQPAEQNTKQKPAEEQAKRKTEDKPHISASNPNAGSEKRDGFDSASGMTVIQFEKNSSKLPPDLQNGLEGIIRMMKDMPQLKIKLYGLASLDESHPMKLSVARATQVEGLLLNGGVKRTRIHINGIRAASPRSGCTEGDECTDARYKLDRVVMYAVVNE
jgi:outer membrane protein OmpA-like peptidoglycan-associated protein